MPTKVDLNRYRAVVLPTNIPNKLSDIYSDKEVGQSRFQGPCRPRQR
jgi:hypothetical protein